MGLEYGLCLYRVLFLAYVIAIRAYYQKCSDGCLLFCHGVNLIIEASRPSPSVRSPILSICKINRNVYIPSFE